MNECRSAELPLVLRRLCAAVERRDVQALLQGFAPDYHSEQPLHPHDARQGRAQIERVWSRPLRDAAELDVALLRWAVAGSVIWSEWRWRGRWPNGTSFDLAGVIIFGVAADRLAWGRLYIESVPATG